MEEIKALIDAQLILEYSHIHVLERALEMMKEDCKDLDLKEYMLEIKLIHK